MFARLSLLPGMLWLDDEGELGEGMLLAVCGWLLLRLEEALLELGCDCDGELEDGGDCDGCAGGCCWVCWLLQPPTTALNTSTDASVRQPSVRPAGARCADFCTAIRRVIVLSWDPGSARADVVPVCAAAVPLRLSRYGTKHG
ncbi:hypothetical protein Maes01_00734 [Microbulbifer aestuariivivens]|uniref:Secreted protein n=1 Tax=Microbulbifer aestuariivivens TaxID=1908308 RepID=A0ABP9WLU9_9GAMM